MFSYIPTCVGVILLFLTIVLLKPYGFSGILFADKTRKANKTMQSIISLRSNITTEGE